MPAKSEALFQRKRRRHAFGILIEQISFIFSIRLNQKIDKIGVNSQRLRNMQTSRPILRLPACRIGPASAKAKGSNARYGNGTRHHSAAIFPDLRAAASAEVSAIRTDARAIGLVK